MLQKSDRNGLEWRFRKWTRAIEYHCVDLPNFELRNCVGFHFVFKICLKMDARGAFKISRDEILIETMSIRMLTKRIYKGNQRETIIDEMRSTV